MADRTLLGELVGWPVVSRRGVTGECEFACRPDIDEVRRQSVAIRRHQPNVLKVGGREVDQMGHNEGEADKLDGSRQLGAASFCRRHFIEGHRRLSLTYRYCAAKPGGP